MCGSNDALDSDLDEALPGEGVGERAVDQADAVLQRGRFVLGRRFERPLQVVEHGHEVLHEALGRARDQIAPIARRPLAVVVELGLQALQRVEVLVALARRLRQLVDRLLDVGYAAPPPARRPRLRGHRLRARLVSHSSTTSYSASSTTSWSSSSVCEAPSP